MENYNMVICLNESNPFSEYMKAIVRCWEKTYYAVQEKALMHFLVLQAQHLVAPHVTVVDMQNWLISQAKVMFFHKFKKEIREGRDLCIAELAWGVNTHLKLHEIVQKKQRDLVCCGLLRLSLASQGDNCSQCLSSHGEFSSPHQLGFRNQANGEGAVTQGGPDDKATSRLVQEALEGIMHDLAYHPATGLQSASEVVVDIVTRLLLRIDPDLDPAEGFYTAGPPNLLWCDMALWIIMSVLMDLTGASQITAAYSAMEQLQISYSQPLGLRLLRSIHADLMKENGGPSALKSSLTARDRNLIGAITKAVTLTISWLITRDGHPPGSSSPCSSLSLCPSSGSTITSNNNNQRLTIYSGTLHDIVIGLLDLIFPEAPHTASGDIFQMRDWPLFDDLENHLSEIPGVCVSQTEREANIRLEPCTVDRIAKTVHGQLVQRSGTNTMLQDAATCKTQMVSRDIVCLIVRAMMKVAPSQFSTGVFMQPGACAELCQVNVHVAKEDHTSKSTGTVPDILLRCTLDKFVSNIFPTNLVTSKVGDIMRNIGLSQQLWTLVQDKLTRAPKSKALLRVLGKWSDTNEADAKLGDMLYHVFAQEFPLEKRLKIEDFMEDKDLCRDVASMISQKLLRHWTPSVTFSHDVKPGGNSLRGKRADTTATVQGELGPHMEDARKPTRRKGVGGFLQRVWRGLKCIILCGSGRAGETSQD